MHFILEAIKLGSRNICSERQVSNEFQAQQLSRAIEG